MPGTKEKIAIGISAAMLAAGLVGTFEPPSPSETQQQRQAAQSQQENGKLSHANETEHERYRAEGNALAEADNADRLTPGEYRPADVPDLHLRILP